MSATLTTAQARRFARWLVDNGYSAVQVVESYGHYGVEAVYVKYENRCGMPRTLESQADFLEVRDS